MSLYHKIKIRWGSMHSENQAIGRGLFTVTTFIFVAKFLGAIKEVILAWRLGAGPEIDAFLFVFNFVNLPISIWFSVVSIILIPILVELKRSSPKKLHFFRKELYGLTIIISGILAIFFFSTMSSGEILSKYGGLPERTLQIAKNLVLPLTFLIPLGLFSSIFSIETMARNSHTNTLLEGLPPAVITIALICYWQNPLIALVLGTLLGVIMQVTCLSVWLKKKHGLPKPTFSFKSSAWKLFVNAIGIILVGQIVQALTAIIDQLYASRLSQGTIAELGYCQRIIGLGLTLGATAISRATLPIFSVQNSDNQNHRSRMVKKWSFVVFVLGGCALIFLLPLAPHAIRLIYERGAFTAENTAKVASLLRFGLLQLPFYFAGLVFVTQIAATRNYRFLTISAIISLAVKIIGNNIAVTYLGSAGLMLSTSIMYMVSMIYLGIVNKYFLNHDMHL